MGMSATIGRLLICVLSLAAAMLLWGSGFLQGAEDALRNSLFGIHSREASGQLHVVEMDAASLAEIDRWPWDRRHYGALVSRLSDAGVRSITFDVDFSTPSETEQDLAFAAALAEAKPTIVLPTFAQRASRHDTRMLDALPIPALRDYAILGSVSIAADGDGFVRRMPLGTLTQGIPRPSLSAQIAGRPGTVDQPFPLDLSIDPLTIPRHSFSDIEHGRFAEADIRGKDVLVGATAIEMGDRYAVPKHGVIPGVIVQAIAAETLFAALPASAGPFVLMAIACAGFAWLLRATTMRQAATRSAVALGTVVSAYGVSWFAFYTMLEAAPAAVAVLFAGAAQLLAILKKDLDHRRVHDSDTGLPNRLSMEREIDPESAACITAIIGNFAALSSVLGDHNAKELLKRVAERLLVGNFGSTVYRIEDRTLAWHSSLEAGEMEAMLKALHALMRRPIEVGGRRVDVQIAFGVAAPQALAEAALSAATALRNAQPWHIHLADEQTEVERQISLMGELDVAIDLGELEVVYQPKLDLKTDRITSVEALVRWNHPQRGPLRPDLFIPMAEDANRICDLTLYVLQRTIDDLAAWCQRGLVVSAAVNISAKLVYSNEFIDKAKRILTETGIPRNRLIFEVTESATIDDPSAAVAALQHFRDLGIAISMDDYGTGQSTLTYLKQLPLSELKIDRSFVQHAHEDANDALLVQSTIDLAHRLGLRVVAEGVEDRSCLTFLREAGCDLAQGYLIGRPTSPEEIREMLTSHTSLAA